MLVGRPGFPVGGSAPVLGGAAYGDVPAIECELTASLPVFFALRAHPALDPPRAEATPRLLVRVLRRLTPHRAEEKPASCSSRNITKCRNCGRGLFNRRRCAAAALHDALREDAAQ